MDEKQLARGEINMQVIHGVKVDGDAIGKGLYEMMPDEDKTVVASGMIPKRWHEKAEKMTEEAIIKLYREQCSHVLLKGQINTWRKYIDQYVVNDILKAIEIGILRAGKARGN